MKRLHGSESVHSEHTHGDVLLLVVMFPRRLNKFGCIIPNY